MPKFTLRFMGFHPSPGERGPRFFKAETTASCDSPEEAEQLVAGITAEPLLVVGNVLPKGNETMALIHRAVLLPVPPAMIEWDVDDPFAFWLKMGLPDDELDKAADAEMSAIVRNLAPYVYKTKEKPADSDEESADVTE